MRASKHRIQLHAPRACWTSARRGSLHVAIHRDVAHAGHRRVVDHCTSRFIVMSRMLDIGASWIIARHDSS
jgi:hypothetical protein